jgi:hypothetical protein
VPGKTPVVLKLYCVFLLSAVLFSCVTTSCGLGGTISLLSTYTFFLERKNSQSVSFTTLSLILITRLQENCHTPQLTLPENRLSQNPGTVKTTEAPHTCWSERERHPPFRWTKPALRKPEHSTSPIVPPNHELRPSGTNPDETAEFYRETRSVGGYLRIFESKRSAIETRNTRRGKMPKPEAEGMNTHSVSQGQKDPYRLSVSTSPILQTHPGHSSVIAEISFLTTLSVAHVDPERACC